jgi:hypothetical protein
MEQSPSSEANNQLPKKFHAFYGIRRFNIVFTSSCKSEVLCNILKQAAFLYGEGLLTPTPKPEAAWADNVNNNTLLKRWLYPGYQRKARFAFRRKNMGNVLGTPELLQKDLLIERCLECRADVKACVELYLHSRMRLHGVVLSLKQEQLYLFTFTLRVVIAQSIQRLATGWKNGI